MIMFCACPVRCFTAGYAFTVANAFKDMTYIVEMDKLLGLEHSPVNEVVLEIFRSAVEEDGLGHLLISELLALQPAASPTGKL